jgi:predicted acylesterase/phospholipase RssA
VLKYLAEQGIEPDVIVASSIGVVNACVYSSGGLPALESAWSEFRSLPLILAPSLRHNPLFGLSFFSMDRLRRAIEDQIDFPKIFESRLELEFILLNLSRGRGELYSNRDCADWQELRTISRAGYAIPFLFPPVKFRGDWFVDGGFAWNVPLEHALGLNPTEIYVLAPIASELPYRASFGSFFSFARRVVDVLWRTIGNMGYIYARMEDGKVNGVPITVFEPGVQWSGFGPLTIFQSYPEKSRNLMEAGYRDAKRVMAQRKRALEKARAAGRKTASDKAPAGRSRSAESVAHEPERDAAEDTSLAEHPQHPREAGAPSGAGAAKVVSINGREP